MDPGSYGYEEGEGDYVPTNPWFDRVGQGSKTVEFVRFQNRLDVITKALDTLSAGVAAVVATEEASVRDYRASAPELFADAEEPLLDELAWTKEFLPMATFGGLLALAFSVFETLLREVASVVEERTGQHMGHPAGPVVEAHLRFFGSATGTNVAAPSDRFVLYRRLRNGVVHKLGGDLDQGVSELFAELGFDGSTVTWRRVVDGALTEVGALAVALDDAYLLAYP